MLQRATERNAGRAPHRRGTGGKDERGVKATRQPRQDGATATGIAEKTEIATDTSQSPRVGIPQHPRGAIRTSGAGDTHPRAPTHPATDQTAGTERTHRAAGEPTHQQRPTRGTTPTTAPYPPSRPTRGRSPKTRRRGHPGGSGGGRPADHAPVPPRQAPRRARSEARAGTSRRGTSTRTARRPSRSWTS